MALIGHLRWATHGDPSDNITNHPHPCDGGWMVHNGVVRNHLELEVKHELLPSGECDSEILARLAEEIGGVNYLERASRAVEVSTGNCVTLSLWARPRVSLVAVRRGNPLAAIESKEGTYLATGFPTSEEAVSFEDGSAWQFTFDKERCDAGLSTRTLKRHHDDSRDAFGGGVSGVHSGSTEYRGG